MTNILEWEPEGPPKNGHQAWRADSYEPHYVEATLRPPPDADDFLFYELHLDVGTVSIRQECHCVAAGQLYAQAWLEQLGPWSERVKVLLDEHQQAAHAAQQRRHGPGYDEAPGTVPRAECDCRVTFPQVRSDCTTHGPGCVHFGQNVLRTVPRAD